MKLSRIIIAALLIILVLSGCNGQANPAIKYDEPKNDQEQQQDKDVPQQDKVIDEKPEIDYKKIQANESGKIMVLMYHGIGSEEKEWVRTVENFKKDLNTLYEKGYRTISLHDYLNNDINVPAGYTPVVITFDDGLRNQFNMVEMDGKWENDPDSAVSVMMDFESRNPGFGNEATFFVYYPVPFRQRDMIKEKFEYLIDNGFDIGNHSYTHENLGKTNAEGIQKQLALNVKTSKEYLQGYDVDTLALPYGGRPKDEALRKYLMSGEYQGTQYTNRAVLLVGSNPAPSPVSKEFDPGAIPRIRASEMNTNGTGIYDWLNYFEKNPGERYFSDGEGSTVVIPKDRENEIDKESIKDKELIIY